MFKNLQKIISYQQPVRLSAILPLAYLASGILFFASTHFAWAASEPYLVDLSKEEPKKAAQRANAVLKQNVTTLLDRKNPSPSGDPRDYISYARYLWPNPNTPSGLPYISKDGHVNQAQVDKGDRATLDVMTSAVNALAIGWAVNHNHQYAKKAGEWIRAWFVDSKTRMTPNLVFAQIELGRNKNRGKAGGGGIIDGRRLPEVADALIMLEGSGALTPSENAAAKAWFAEYFHWLETSPQGKSEHAKPGNHGSWFLVQEIALARFVGDDEAARALCEGVKERISRDIEPDGGQPLEFKRVDGLTYSVFSLRAQAQIAKLALPLGIDLWHYQSPRGGSLVKALDFLRPYNQAPGKWPYSQKARMTPGFLNGLFEEVKKLEAKPAK